MFAVLSIIVGVVILLARRAKMHSTSKDLFAEEPSVFADLLQDETTDEENEDAAVETAE